MQTISAVRRCDIALLESDGLLVGHRIAYHQRTWSKVFVIGRSRAGPSAIERQVVRRLGWIDYLDDDRTSILRHGGSDAELACVAGVRQ